MLKKYGAKYGTAAKYTAFDGAFKVTKWTNTSEKWTAVKNPYYYAKSAVKLQKLNYQVVKDSNTAHQLFQQGSLDDAVVSGTTAQGLQNNKNLYYIYRSGNNFVNLNMAKGAVLANKQLRQALYLAVNRTQLSKKVLANGSPTPSQHQMPQRIQPVARTSQQQRSQKKLTMLPRLKSSGKLA